MDMPMKKGHLPDILSLLKVVGLLVLSPEAHQLVLAIVII